MAGFPARRPRAPGLNSQRRSRSYCCGGRSIGPLFFQPLNCRFFSVKGVSMQRLIILLVLVGALVSQQGLAQQHPAQDAVVAYVTAMADGRFDEAADLVRSADMKQARTVLLPAFETAMQDDNNTVPAEIFGEEATFGTVKTMQPYMFFGRMLAYGNGKTSERYDSMETLVLGTVPEDDELAHVLTRRVIRSRGRESSSLQLLTLAPDGAGNWQLFMPDEVNGWIRSIRSSLTRKRR